MTTATAPDLTLALLGGRYHFLLRRLHSLTGVMFGGYLIVHLIVNATIAQGEVYQKQVDKIHSLPWLPVIEWVFIYLPIIFHAIYGTWIILTGQPNNSSYPYLRNWNYLLQRISAVIIIVFIAFHVLSLKYGLFGRNLAFDPEHAISTVKLHMQYSPTLAWSIYPLFILAACFHTANGFFTAAITWGLTVSANAQRRWGMACIGLFVLLFVAGMVALVAAAV